VITTVLLSTWIPAPTVPCTRAKYGFRSPVAVSSMPASRKAGLRRPAMTGTAPCDIVPPHALTRSANSVPSGGARPGRRGNAHERAALPCGEPVARRCSAARGVAAATALGVEGNPAVRTRLVVADDSPPYLELLVLVLGQMPEHEVVGTAADGREAVRVAVEREADVVLLDVEMPGLDGFAAAEEIRRLRPQTDLLLHTGMLVDDRRRRAEQLNLQLFDKLELARTIESLVRIRRTHRSLSA
jgi:CheY-like chemotaxis protein